MDQNESHSTYNIINLHTKFNRNPLSSYDMKLMGGHTPSRPPLVSTHALISRHPVCLTYVSRVICAEGLDFGTEPARSSARLTKSKVCIYAAF